MMNRYEPFNSLISNDSRAMALAMATSLKALQWTPEDSANSFEIPLSCMTWDEFMTLLGIQLTFGFFPNYQQIKEISYATR